jgi:hypothetical protein
MVAARCETPGSHTGADRASDAGAAAIAVSGAWFEQHTLELSLQDEAVKL